MSALNVFAADPYHPPGYAGYVPQTKFRHSQTFGRTTHGILNDGLVKATGKLGRSVSVEDFSKIDSGTITGYTGHIPNSRDAYGISYVPTMNNSLETFKRSKSTKEQLRKTKLSPSFKLERSMSTELLPAIKKIPNNKQTDRGVISGYSGFIPKIQHRFAKSFLNRVDEARSLPKDWQSSDVKIAKQYNVLYHDTGCIPRYTGFLPGHQFRHAMTYGNSSRSIDAK